MWHKNLSPNLKALAPTASGRFPLLFRSYRVKALSISLSAAMLLALAPAGHGRVLPPPLNSGAETATAQIAPRRIVTLRHNDTAEGSRCTVTSDSLLDDYSSYVEGERFLVRLPQARLFNAHKNPTGRGFADMRVEQGEEDVVISFLLRAGVSVSVNQSFNRLEINFQTNERAGEQGQDND